jgi:ubiquinone/menaquinone biosynthesis C-methylase UbiE
MYTAMDEYIFANAIPTDELERLRLLESALDDATRSCLLSCGLFAGQSCLEVGAGAGSVANWLGSQVGPGGEVLAVDVDDKFLHHLDSPVRVFRGDIRSLSVPPNSFDLAHARYVLIHNAGPDVILDAMLRGLKPGGVLVLEEPDFSTANALLGPLTLKNAFNNVTRAIDLTFRARGLNYAFGQELPSLVESTPLSIEAISYDCHVHKGGSRLAKMMCSSTLSLREKYIATGAATGEDINGYVQYATRPDCWGVYYSTVRILAKKAVF